MSVMSSSDTSSRISEISRELNNTPSIQEDYVPFHSSFSPKNIGNAYNTVGDTSEAVGASFQRHRVCGDRKNKKMHEEAFASLCGQEEGSIASAASVSSVLSRASESIRSAGETLKTLQSRLNSLKHTRSQTLTLHQKAVHFICEHDVDLHHLQQVEREHMFAAENTLQRSALQVLLDQQKILVESRKKDEADLLQHLQQWKQELEVDRKVRKIALEEELAMQKDAAEESVREKQAAASSSSSSTQPQTLHAVSATNEGGKPNEAAPKEPGEAIIYRTASELSRGEGLMKQQQNEQALPPSSTSSQLAVPETNPRREVLSTSGFPVRDEPCSCCCQHHHCCCCCCCCTEGVRCRTQHGKPTPTFLPVCPSSPPPCPCCGYPQMRAIEETSQRQRQEERSPPAAAADPHRGPSPPSSNATSHSVSSDECAHRTKKRRCHAERHASPQRVDRVSTASPIPSTSRHPPFLPSGPLYSPSVWTGRSWEDEEGIARPVWSTHHVSALLSTADRQNLLRPRAYYQRVGGRLVDITDTTYRRMHSSSAPGAPQRIGKAVSRGKGSTRKSSSRRGVACNEEEEVKAENFNAGVPSRNSIPRRVFGHQSSHCSSCSPHRRRADLRGTALRGRKLVLDLQESDEQRGKELRDILSDIRHEKRYCDALYNHMLALPRH